MTAMEPGSLDAQRSSPDPPVSLTVTVGITLAEMEQLLIEATLRWTKGNRKRTARILGVDRATVYNKIKRYAADKGSTADDRPV